jgi:tetratricopeptide (TPR) repeat protein
LAGTHVWAEAYDRPLEQDALRSLEREICARVVAATADIHGVLHRAMAQELYGTPPADLSAHQALLKFYGYLRFGTGTSYREAKLALENAVQADPNCGPAWAALGAIDVDDYAFDHAPQENLDRGLAFVDRAFRLNAGDYVVQYLRARVYFYTRSADEFMQAVELAVETNPQVSTNGELAAFCSAAGQPERGVALYNQVRQANPRQLGYSYYAPFLDHLYRSEYEQALHYARQIQMPLGSLDPIARAVALGHLGRRTEAQAALAELLQLRSNFAARGREMIHRIFRYDRPVELLLEGLNKTGLILAP